jgi:hypothetical protein
VSCDKSIYNNLFTEMYTVTYDGNGFTAGNPPSGSPFIYTLNGTVTVPGNTGDFRGPLIQDGITQRFTGWNTAADGTGTAYAADDTFIMGSADITLYAQWTTDSSVITKIGPAGGYIFYEDTGYAFPTWQYMEAAPVDLFGPWGCQGVEIPGDQENGISYGPQNTADIIATCVTAGIGAELCNSYVLNGYTDWFMPSFDELQAMYDNLYAPDPVADIAGFHGNSYWSSTEEQYWLDLEYYGIVLEFGSGGNYLGGKYTPMFIRPARRF